MGPARVAAAPARRRRLPAPGPRSSGRRSRASRPGRRRRPGRPASRGTRAWPARRGWPWARRRRRAIGVRPSSSRSDEMSRTVAGVRAARGPPRAPRWTPPMPPVAKTPDAGGVGGDHRGRHRRGRPAAPASATARLGRAALRTEPGGAVAEGLEAASSRPTRNRPSWIATVAGTAPLSADRGFRRARDLDVLRDTAGRG